VKKVQQFYCRVNVGGKRYWGYREALTSDLALACFIQDKGFNEEDIGTSFADTVDHLLVKRLQEFIPEDFDPWGCETPFTLSLVEEVDEGDIEEYEADAPFDEMGRVTNRIWHAARVLWLVMNPENLEDPISVDNHCHYGHVYPVPEIMDGWHRFYAHQFLGRERIPTLYGGRVDLKDYLSGKRDKPPE
jgi:hypothetical protein